MKAVVIIFFCMIGIITVQAQTCAPIVRPALSNETRKDFEQKLSAAKADYAKDSANADAIIWYGRRIAYLGNYEKAINIFTKGIALHPSDARMYRHRGHRYITLRCFDKAIKDFKTAAQLIKGKADETEPDGLPNAQNISTSTLQSNIWYHLGLAYYVKGEYKNAIRAYKKALKVSKNHDMYIATANWMNLALQRLGKKKKANDLINSIDPNWQLIENTDYLKIIQLFQNKPPCTDLVRGIENSTRLGSATLGFGAGSYCLLSGDEELAIEIFKKIVSGNQWASFGYIATEQELKRLH